MVNELFNAEQIIGVEPANINDFGVKTINSYFNIGLFNSKFDLVILKQALEHIKFPDDLLRDVQHLLNDGGHVYIEVPDLDMCLDNILDDFHPEHVSYFTEMTLRQLLNKAGFKAIIEKKRKFSLCFCIESTGNTDCL